MRRSPSHIHIALFALILSSSCAMRADETTIPEIHSGEALQEWLRGTKWRNETNGAVRIFERNEIVRRSGKGRFPFSVIDATHVTAKPRNVLTFTFDDDYQAFTSSYRNQRFQLISREQTEVSNAVPDEVAVADTTTNLKTQGETSNPKETSATKRGTTVPATLKKNQDKTGQGASARNSVKQPMRSTTSVVGQTWFPWAVGVVFGVSLLIVGLIINFVNRPVNPHNNFPEFDVSTERIDVLPCQYAAVILISALLGGVGAGFEANAATSGETLAVILWGLFGLVFVMIGVWGSLVRSKSEIDRSQKTVCRTLKVLGIPISKTKVNMSEITHVHLEKHESRSTDDDGESNLTVSYSVSLPYGEDGDNLSLISSSEIADARERASFFAEFIGTNLHDETKRSPARPIR